MRLRYPYRSSDDKKPIAYGACRSFWKRVAWKCCASYRATYCMKERSLNDRRIRYSRVISTLQNSRFSVVSFASCHILWGVSFQPQCDTLSEHLVTMQHSKTSSTLYECASNNVSRRRRTETVGKTNLGLGSASRMFFLIRSSSHWYTLID